MDINWEWGLFCVATTRNVGHDLVTFGDVGDMSATRRRHVELSTLTLPHEFINISASVAGVLYLGVVPGCTTFENQDASKIASEGRMSIPN